MIPWLDPYSLEFPDPETALQEPDGLLAAGGDLRPKRIINAYKVGVFPWYNPGEPILWWSPNPRCVLFPQDLHISRSLRKHLRHNDYRVSSDEAFEEVMRACAAPRPQSEYSWISEEIIAAYTDLHKRGFAHSIEIWDGDELVGGLYGIAMGAVFFGESMFSRRTDVSKMAFVYLVKQLTAIGYELIDCQVYNPHLATLGATTIPRRRFLAMIKELTGKDVHWSFNPDYLEEVLRL